MIVQLTRIAEPARATAGAARRRDHQVGRSRRDLDGAGRRAPVVRLVELEDDVPAVGIDQEVIRAGEAVGDRRRDGVGIAGAGVQGAVMRLLRRARWLSSDCRWASARGRRNRSRSRSAWRRRRRWSWCRRRSDRGRPGRSPATVIELTSRSGGGVRFTVSAVDVAATLLAVAPFWNTWPFMSVWTMK